MPSYMNISWLSRVVMQVEEDDSTVLHMVRSQDWAMRGSDYLFDELFVSYPNEMAMYN